MLLKKSGKSLVSLTWQICVMSLHFFTNVKASRGTIDNLLFYAFIAIKRAFTKPLEI